MAVKTRAVVIVALSLVLLGGLFPPRKSPPPSREGGYARVASRGFLFSGDLYIAIEAVPGGENGYPAEIDTGKMLAEWAVILSVAGILLTLFQIPWPGASPHPQPLSPGERGRG